MEKLFQLLKEKLSDKHLDLGKEALDVFQFPIFQDGQQVDFAVLEKGTSHSPHIHEECSSSLYVITGNGVVMLGGKKLSYEAGQTFMVPKGMSHGFEVQEDTVLLSIQDKAILNNDVLDFKYEK